MRTCTRRAFAPLEVEPGGAELASPSKMFVASRDPGAEPDPHGRIIRDDGRLIVAETAVVPPRVEPGKTARVHVLLRPNAVVKAHWNNEVDPLRVWGVAA